ncbi:LPXTG-site transpeptidase (sortase) family protein [Crossiella equi]|uniref:LPXTG-site transpeptidase (Sortase) family protein n=1 Tax=Crossiella equi TaxID=130796 RepID=A0ABS5AED9_9PSEU|nr:class F sortase [Crossiella equi]MBP2474672.1 LPXTG-site transpeptidase (sortase) family protein [Crossiella equi]
MRRAGVAGLLLAVLLGTGACGSGPGPVPEPLTASATSTTAEAPPAEVAALPKSTPTRVRVPKIGADSSLVPLGLNQDQTVQVPPVTQPMQAGWFTGAPSPGEKGPAVVLGHVDGGGKAGIFHKLRQVEVGDEVLVDREDGRTARFVVHETQQVAKKDFPTDRVYGDTDRPEIRLITCGGIFDRGARSYQDNVIVYATLAGSGA